VRQIPLDIGPAPEFTFASFAARGNEAAVSHLQALSPGAPPVYLWGPAGSGKTHLLRAAGAAAQEAGLAAAWFGPQVPCPWEAPARPAWLLIDDCHRLPADAQQAAFGLFVHAAAVGATVIASGACPPVDLPVRDDLRTRLAWGHVFALHPLAEAEVRGRLRIEADRRGVHLSDEVMAYLLTRFERDLAHLLPLLARLDGFGLAERRALTVPLLKKMLAEEGETT
jgi:DnaA family protein